MIEVNNLQVKYDDFIAIDNVNFTVKKGNFFTLLGPSGCGKTTTLRAIAGFNTPSQGQIMVGGQDITYVPVEKRNLGMVFQSYALFPTMTVFDNNAYGLEVERKSKDFIRNRVNELAQLVELNESQLKRNVSELSGGQQQRVAIARALAKNPEVVLFDEPLSNLDAKLRKQLRAELKEIQRNTGMTAIYVTHDQEEALEMSDRIAVFNNGHIDQVGTPEEVYDRSATEFVCNFIGDANRVERSFIDRVNQQFNAGFDPLEVHYIREEKIKTWQDESLDNQVTMDATILEMFYHGATTTYILDIKGVKVRMIEKNDGNLVLNKGDQIQVYLNLDDILHYVVTTNE